MIISIIGSGNTATVLGRIFKEKNHTINEIAGRNKIEVIKLAEELNANACIELKELNKNSDVYIIAVKDNAVAEASAQLKLDEKVVAHTAGSISINILKNTAKNYGVLYSLQSLRKEISYLPGIPFLIDANNGFTNDILFRLAASVATSVTNADDETRLQYHVSAVIVSNFTNHLFALAKNYCDKTKTDFNLLLPLIDETVNRLHYYEPSAMQTGPAIRNDETTMQKHLQLLNDFPQLKNIYELMSESIAELKR